MPEISGGEAARHIRELQGGREVKIAGLTASAFASEREEVLAAGMDDFVRKPYRPDKICDCMARQLGVRYRHIQNAVPSSARTPSRQHFQTQRDPAKNP
jgi:CheY-like chemotaxis protein